MRISLKKTDKKTDKDPKDTLARKNVLAAAKIGSIQATKKPKKRKK